MLADFEQTKMNVVCLLTRILQCHDPLKRHKDGMLYSCGSSIVCVRIDNPDLILRTYDALCNGASYLRFIEAL